VWGGLDWGEQRARADQDSEKGLAIIRGCSAIVEFVGKNRVDSKKQGRLSRKDRLHRGYSQAKSHCCGRLLKGRHAIIELSGREGVRGDRDTCQVRTGRKKKRSRYN